jgi:hypothetical protein
MVTCASKCLRDTDLRGPSVEILSVYGDRGCRESRDPGNNDGRGYIRSIPVHSAKMAVSYLWARERGSSYRLPRGGDRIPRLGTGEGSRSLRGGDLSRTRGERP